MTVLILRHTPGNHLGHLVKVLEEHGLRYEYRNIYRMSVEEIRLTCDTTGIILLGGYESIREEEKHTFMAAEQQLIRDAIQEGLPVFGICLGAQMIARSLGGTVEKNLVTQPTGESVPMKEIGWFPLVLTEAGKSDPVLSVLDGQAQFQWHEDTFYLPKGIHSLAKTNLCPRQAFCVNPKTYSVQFHPEVTREIIENWLEKSTTLPLARINAIRAETITTYEERSARSREMFVRYCAQAF